MELTFILITLFGGLGLFIYGTHLTSEGLQKEAASKMQIVMAKLTDNRFTALITGIVITVLLQSSSATAVLLVSFVSAKLLSMNGALGVVLGAAIGTTFTVQLIAFKVTDYALFFVGAGAIARIFGRSDRAKNIGQAVLGFGFLFYGMAVMSDALLPLRNYEGFINILIALDERPILMLIVATLLTAVIQSSAAVIAIAMNLALQGVISLEAALPIVFGANIGTTSTALISSLASNMEAKKVAVVQVLFRVIGVILFMPFLLPFSDYMTTLSGDIARQIANAHTFFNIITALVLLPFTKVFANLINKLMPKDEEEEDVAKYLDRRVLEVPDLALDMAKSEIIHMGKLVERQIANIPPLIKTRNIEIVRDISDIERKVDFLHREISTYLTSVTQRNLSASQSEREVKLLYISNDLEHIGDIIIDTTKLTTKMSSKGVFLSPEVHEELNLMIDDITKNYQDALKSIIDDDVELASQVIKSNPKVQRLEKSLRFNHFIRQRGCENPNADLSSIHLDLINNLLRINTHSVSIAQAVMGNL
ncbi:phosphate:Na+ symporter [Desulfitispora alkaliphila]|uniref:Na/Pi cotransporter family protein n=1 Tax=Desulfitispora alkaliphila TaxID=622674 RepID=UPI003D1D69C0